MLQKSNLLRDEILCKQKILNDANDQLKKEFVGIDKVIDQITESVSSWFIFPGMQNKPVVINLWGLTGVGKTSLIQRLGELINFEKKFFRFDMGEVADNSWAIRGNLENIYQSLNGQPHIIALDEFQLAKTKSELGEEKNNPATRIVWDLLDSGCFQMNRYLRDMEEVPELIRNLKYLIKQGVKVENGIVIEMKEVFLKTLRHEKAYRSWNDDPKLKLDNILFVSEFMRSLIYDWLINDYEDRFALDEELNSLDAQESLRYLSKVYESCISPIRVDCSRAVVFVVGNLDDAYSMSNDFNPDMNADDFHEQSLRINITHIKNVLRKKFRSEQIARLGNIHIIYPAFNESSYRKIIDLELAKIADRFYQSQKLRIEFSNSLRDVIFKEGVYPSQGTRPLYTTIHQIVNSKLGKIFSNKELHAGSADSVILSYENNEMKFYYFKGRKKLFNFSEKIILNLEVLRQPLCDDLQTVVAVHESGHAILTFFLLNAIPDRIFSTTVDTESAGFVYMKNFARVIPKKEILPRLAQILGGYIAEKAVFGEDYVTVGSESDIAKATQFALEMIKSCGMGKLPVHLSIASIHSNLYVTSENQNADALASEWIEQSLVIAEKVLDENKELLLHLSDYLSRHRSITKDEFKKFLVRYTTYPVKEIVDHTSGENNYYRHRLKEQLQNLKQEDQETQSEKFPSFDFSLNKMRNAD